jgi:hypothetical protein
MGYGGGGNAFRKKHKNGQKGDGFMMKRKLSRMIAAVLTCAMAFSVLAVPAMAENDDITDDYVAYAKMVTGLVESTTVGGETVGLVTPRAYCTDGNSNLATDDKAWAAYVKAQTDGENPAKSECWDSIPEDAVVGYQTSADNGWIIWLSEPTKATIDAVLSNDSDATMTLDWTTGKVQIGNDSYETITSDRAVSEQDAANAKAVVIETEYDEDLGYTISMIVTKELFLAGEEATGTWAEEIQEACMWYNCTIYTGTVPSGALYGYQKEETKQIVWLDETDDENVSAAKTKLHESGKEITSSINWSTGVITIGDTNIETLTTRLNAQKAASNDDSTALLIVGGAVAAAGVATAVYFYTHPAVWQKVVNNVRSALGLPTTNAAAAESAEAPETAETEEAAETAEAAETTEQAA